MEGRGGGAYVERRLEDGDDAGLLEMWLPVHLDRHLLERRDFDLEPGPPCPLSSLTRRKEEEYVVALSDAYALLYALLHVAEVDDGLDADDFEEAVVVGGLLEVRLLLLLLLPLAPDVRPAPPAKDETGMLEGGGMDGGMRMGQPPHDVEYDEALDLGEGDVAAVDVEADFALYIGAVVLDDLLHADEAVVALVVEAALELLGMLVPLVVEVEADARVDPSTSINIINMRKRRSRKRAPMPK